MKPGDAESLLAGWRVSLSAAGRPDEWESKRLLAGSGIGVPRGALIQPGARPEAPDVPFPWVVKVCSADVLHKTDRGGVRLGVTQIDAPGAVEAMRRAFPDSAVLVEEMVRSQGVEIIVGALYDPSFGPAVMAGAGGILTELYKDVSFRLAPCSRDEARRMLEELTVYPALCGYRGLAADVEALAALVERIAGLATDLIGPGDQLDINPVVWAGERWVALDAKIVLAPA